MIKIKTLAMSFMLPACLYAAQVEVINSITVDPTVINNYDKVNVEMLWSVNSSTAVSVGDTFSVVLPDQMKPHDATTNMLDASGNDIGDCELVDRTFTCTFTQKAVGNGTISFEREFYDASVSAPNTTVPITFLENGNPVANIDMTVSPSLVNPAENLFKVGNPESTLSVGEQLGWFVRINCRQDNITGLNFSDKIGPGHTLIADSVYLAEGDCNEYGDIPSQSAWMDNGVTQTLPAGAAASVDEATGEIGFSAAQTNKAFILVYKTKITEIRNPWTNDVSLTGNNGGINESQTEGVDYQIINATGNQVGTAQGVVFHDENDNGSADPGEGIADIDVVVKDISGTAITVTTDADGNWSTPVRSGDVSVDVDENDPDMPTDLVQSVGEDPTTITVPAGGVGKTLDGYRNDNNTATQTGIAEGVVFQDENDNGVVDPGEGIAGIDVVVTDSAGTAITVTTDADGNWSTPVLAGDVSVNVDENDPDMPAGLTQTVGDDSTALSVPADGVGTTLDGYRNDNNTATQTGTVEGVVFQDENSNGVVDPGEGIVGIDVVVTDSAGTAITVITDADGNWSTPVLAGDISVAVDENDPDMPAGLTQTVGDNSTKLSVPAGGVGTTLDGYGNNNNSNNNNNRPANIPAVNGSGLLALLLMIITLGAIVARRKVS